MRQKNSFHLVGFIVLSVLLALWSYIFVDPNLILINKLWWVEIQQGFWQFLGNWDLLTFHYVFFVFTWFVLYLWGAKKSTKITPFFWGAFAIICSILWLGHNALSHDIFNYLFNAKMVVEYGVNPHVRTALEFSYDPWVRFMHNVHTTAPYGYGWTVLSTIPYFLGFGSFLVAYFVMKLWMALGLVAYLLLGWALLQRMKLPDLAKRFWLFALNPLLLWETLLNGHNDVWMMWPALAAFGILTVPRRKLWHVVLAAFLLALSISIKIATVALIPIAVFLVFWPLLRTARFRLPLLIQNLGDHGQRSWASYAALALFIPLITDRSQQFLPWYLIWSWSFFPLVQWRWLRWLLLVFSCTSLLRYVSWLRAGLEYSPAIQQEMRFITWSAVGITIVLLAVRPAWRWLLRSR